jgi:3'-5' exoribonuclease
MKTRFVESLKAGETVDDAFVLVEKHLAQKRDGENYLNITLADRTGRLKGVVWDDVARIAAAVQSGEFVHVKGSLSEYRGLLQLVIRDMVRCPEDAVTPADFLPVTARDVDKMLARLKEVTASVGNGYLKQLFEGFWNDADFVQAFKTAPAAKKMHHAYLGGLLEHTLSMTLLADTIAGHYRDVDRDLLVAGAFLHDVGKTREFEYRVKIDYSDEGRLISHIVIAVQMLEDKIRPIDGFPAELACLLKHFIVSHHGSREFGSPEPPKTIEAVLLHFIDEIDSKVNGIREFINAEAADETWTSYHRLLERHFYRGRPEGSEE